MAKQVVFKVGNSNLVYSIISAVFKNNHNVSKQENKIDTLNIFLPEL